MKKICVYGKGGIGKSTTVTNVAAAMAEDGLRVAVVGCDPKADTTRCLVGRRIPTVLDQLEAGPGAPVAFAGYRGVLCIESGGPEPGTGCAGRGIAAALREIQSRSLLDGMDVVLYDVLGDVVCGGFSMPLREGIAEDVYLVTTADFMAIYAANNICRGIAKYAADGGVRLSGVVYNARSGRDEPGVAEAFARAVGTELTQRISMSGLISRAELERATVLERYPDSEVAAQFRSLARGMLRGGARCVPHPLGEEEVEALCRF
ncbi:nitrogenase iron protein [Oscillospiraceae bacterium]|nr:nitrogenase iron protein [Oscillospiraceae bacterium]BDF75588.1 nitrogenase iron protein [Oscillospiraceae bacterium]